MKQTKDFDGRYEMLCARPSTIFDSAMRRFESSRPSHIVVRKRSHLFAPAHKLLNERQKPSTSGRHRPHAVT
jgi:hypothetical protein